MPLQRQPVIGLVSAAVLLLGAAGLLCDALSHAPRQKLFLAPMLEVTDSCVLPGNANANVPASLQTACTQGDAASAAALVEQTLAQLPDPSAGPTAQQSFELGYTLPIPLMQLYAQDANTGQWRIQQERVDRFVRTLRDAPQSAIVYLFATHFSAHSPIEEALAQDSANLAHTPQGAIPPSDYLGSPLYAWSVARTDNPLTHYRQDAIRAVLHTICEAGEPTIAKVRGLTLLGEVHQLFPNFATGTGYTEPYLITDYSDASIQQLRAYLQAQFGTLERLNRALGGQYSDWNDISAPRSDVLTLPAEQWQARRLEHLDAYSHGLIPVGGWTYVADPLLHAQSRILVYVDGKQVARLPINQGRQDVLDARPEFGDRAVGWQTYLDFSQWTSGTHQVRTYLETPGQALQLMSSKALRVATSVPEAAAESSVRWPYTAPARTEAAFYVDLPREDRAYLFNPLAPLWHAFRQEQVNAYLRSFIPVFENSCLAKTPLYLHQIIPHTNPGWDPQKFAIQRSLKAQPQLRLGVSLYGEPGMSESFLNNLNAQGHHHYGITEFHPLKPLTPEALQRALQSHRQAGAQFFSFFIEPVWNAKAVERIANPFSLSPHNSFKGSDTTFESLRTILQQ